MLQSRSCQFAGIVAVCYLLLIVPADATAPAYLFGPSLASAGSLLAHKIVLRLTTTSTCWMFKLQFSTDCRLRVPNSEHIPNIAEMPWKHCWKTCCFAALALFLYASCVETTVRCCQSISSQSSPSHQRDRKDLPIFALYQLSYNSRSCTAPVCRLLGWHSHFAKLLPGGTFFSVHGFTLAGCILTLLVETRKNWCTSKWLVRASSQPRIVTRLERLSCLYSYQSNCPVQTLTERTQSKTPRIVDRVGQECGSCLPFSGNYALVVISSSVSYRIFRSSWPSFWLVRVLRKPLWSG